MHGIEIKDNAISNALGRLSETLRRRIHEMLQNPHRKAASFHFAKGNKLPSIWLLHDFFDQSVILGVRI